MAPKDYIAARNTQTNNNSDYHVLVDDRPYYPFLKVDGSDQAAIPTAVAKIIMHRTTTNNKDDSMTISTLEHGHGHDHKSWPVTVVSGGITNQLFRVDVFVNGNNNNNNKHPKSVLVRIFGAEGMIDRDIENATFAALAAQGLAPAYYGRFANGRIEEFLDGMRPLSTRDLGIPEISQAIARQMALMHGQFVVPDDLQEYHNVTNPSMWTQLHSWMKQAASATFQTDADTARGGKLPLNKIEAELTWLEKEIIPTDSTISFCHNDVLAANVLYMDPKDNNDNSNNNQCQVRLIDFEYGGSNYIGFDIANHFNEYAGGCEENGVTNYDWFPTKEHQLAFLKAYLEASSSSTTTPATVDDAEVVDLYDRVQPFILADHLYWGVWAVNQAATEGCQSFDYLEFAKNRLGRYFDCKAKDFDGVNK